MIHPLSKFGLAWVAANCIFLAYIAVVTPPMIALYWLDDPCQSPPTIVFDTALDVFFILDICMNFFMAVIQAGTYLDDFRTVSRSYLKGYFLFDVVTSIPVSFFELIATAQCGAAAAAAAGTTVDAEDTRYFQILSQECYSMPAEKCMIYKIARHNNRKGCQSCRDTPSFRW